MIPKVSHKRHTRPILHESKKGDGAGRRQAERASVKTAAAPTRTAFRSRFGRHSWALLCPVENLCRVTSAWRRLLRLSACHWAGWLAG